MTTKLSHGTSGALRQFAGWVARGTVGYPLFDGSTDYWQVLRDEPSAMESLFAVFANVLELDEEGEPTNAKYAERRAAAYLYEYLTGSMPEGEPDLDEGETDLY